MADARPWAAAAAATLTDWPTLAAPMIDALATGDPTPTVPGGVVDGLASGLADRMLQTARAAVQFTAQEAADQGVDSPGAEPDEGRIRQLAATFAGLIAAGYESVAAQAALSVPLTEGPRLNAAASAIKDAVRTALTALGTAVSGLVPAHVGAAMAAAEHAGAVAVFEAHPPRYLVASETHEDANRCQACTDVNGKRYQTLADGLEDYPNIGYRACRAGSTRCRGRLRAVWREETDSLVESSSVEVPGDGLQLLPVGDRGPSRRDALRGAERAGGGRLTAPLVEDDSPVHTGAMLALVPTAEDAARLAVDGGEDAGELHLTLAYLGKAAAIGMPARQQLLDDLTAAVNGLAVVEGNAFALAVFNPNGDEPCRVALVGGDWVDGIHRFLMDALRLPLVPDAHAPWIPHVTLAFDGDFGRLEELASCLGPVTFDRVRLAIGGQYVDIPLIDDSPQIADWLSAVAEDGRFVLHESAKAEIMEENK